MDISISARFTASDTASLPVMKARLRGECKSSSSALTAFWNGGEGLGLSILTLTFLIANQSSAAMAFLGHTETQSKHILHSAGLIDTRRLPSMSPLLRVIAPGSGQDFMQMPQAMHVD
jgi:hypothetical protein